VLEFMLKAHVPTANRAHQRWMLDRMKDIILPPYGKLLAKDYYRVASILKEQGLINNIPKFKDFYKETYVKK
jgi:NitT/TauT family transport system substrate-binding protein